MTTTTMPAVYLVTFPNGHAVAMHGNACRKRRDTHAARGVKIDELPHGGFSFQPHSGEDRATLYEAIVTRDESVKLTADRYAHHIYTDGEWCDSGIVKRAQVWRMVVMQSSRYARTMFGLADGTIVVLVDSRPLLRFTPKEN